MQFQPGQIWLDTDGQPIQAHGGGIWYENGNYYWYGENKSDGYTFVGVSCYSSTDLYHWKNEGLVLSAQPDSPDHDLFFENIGERPKVLRCPSTGKYVLWIHMDKPGYDYARTGRAISDSPTGPFEYIGSISPASSDSRDMTLFQDTDGTAYVVFATHLNRVTRIVRLTTDYLNTTDTVADAFIGEAAHSGRESPAIFQRNGLYYFVGSGCSGWNANAAEYAVAPSPLGPWQVIGNPCVGAGAERTFNSQNTFVLPVAGEKDAYIFLADRWTPENIGDSRYVWLPISWEGENQDYMAVGWNDTWELDIFPDSLSTYHPHF